MFPQPFVQVMRNVGQCHIFLLIRTFSFTMTASQSPLTLTQPTFHFLLFFVYFPTIQQPSFPPFSTSCLPCPPSILSRSAVSGPGRFAGGGDSQGVESEAFKSLFISEAIRRHLVPHAQFVTEQNARRCPWG